MLPPCISSSWRAFFFTTTRSTTGRLSSGGCVSMTGCAGGRPSGRATTISASSESAAKLLKLITFRSNSTAAADYSRTAVRPACAPVTGAPRAHRSAATADILHARHDDLRARAQRGEIQIRVVLLQQPQRLRALL